MKINLVLGTLFFAFLAAAVNLQGGQPVATAPGCQGTVTSTPAGCHGPAMAQQVPVYQQPMYLQQVPIPTPEPPRILGCLQRLRELCQMKRERFQDRVPVQTYQAVPMQMVPMQTVPMQTVPQAACCGAAGL